MSINDIARSMRARMPWDVANRALKSIDAPRSMGWERTLAKLSEAEDDDGDLESRLSAALIEHTLVGEKLVRFFHLPEDKIAALRAAVLDAEIEKNLFSSPYPALLPEAELASNYPQKHTLTAIEKGEDGIGIIFSSIRSITVREEISKSELPNTALPAIAGFDELYGVRYIRHQASDVVWIPHDGNLVDVRIDYPKGMNFEMGTAAHSLVYAALQDRFGTELGTPLNLFPLIQAIYETPGEGRLVEFQFGTTTASLKHERMRRGRECLRKEAYHLGGKEALQTPLQPFKLSVEYKIALHNDEHSYPELNIHGNSRMTGMASPVVMDATIRKCVGTADFEHIRDRIAHFLIPATADAAA